MKFGKLDLNPAKNPAVLDTATWDGTAAWEAVRAKGSRWLAVKDATATGSGLPALDGIVPHAGSCVRRGQTIFLLAALPDAQEVFVTLGAKDGAEVLGDPLGRTSLRNGDELAAYPAQAAVIDRFCRVLNPPNAPRPLGQTPRLGIGVRMTTAAWPGIFDAMDRRGFAANSIQNSVRELNLLDDLLAGKPAPTNYACGFGTIETGYTGSSFEGLWVAGVLAALRHGAPLRYGADADHIQVKRADAGLAWARRTLAAARHYTFFTLDVSDVLDYRAARDSDWAEARFPDCVPDAGRRRDLLAWHAQARPDGDRSRPMDPATATRFAVKYAGAMDALAALRDHLDRLKDGRPFDLELSIDEHPPEVRAFDCLTSDEELLFVLRELRRRGLPVTHVAPNFGVEKGWDYRHPDGMEGLRRRVEAQHRLAESFGVMLDFHSADDLGPAARAAFRSATGGRLHYKVSPRLQILFADVLRDVHPDLFERWWRDAEAYARREAAAGSPFAAECLVAAGAPDLLLSPRHPVFHHYSFAFVGRRDEAGQFRRRQEFYELSPAFYQAYRDRLARWLCQLADELF